MKGKYTYYWYEYDGDGGDAIKRSEEFKPLSTFYNHREKIGDFDTAEELATLADISVNEAQDWINRYEENSEYYA